MSSTTNSSTQHTSTIGAIGTPSRRNTELALLAFAVVIPVFAYANVGLALNDEVPAGLAAYGIGLGVLAGIGHLVIRKFAPYADPPLEAMGLGITASEFVSSFYPGGALALHNTLVWSSLMGTRDDRRRPLHNRRVRHAMRHLPVGPIAAAG